MTLQFFVYANSSIVFVHNQKIILLIVYSVFVVITLIVVYLCFYIYQTLLVA